MRNPLQQKVADFERAHELGTDAPARVLDLVSEVGELAKETLNGTEYGQREFEVPPMWESEVGDVLYSLITLANATDIDLGHALDRALEKYTKRIERAGGPGSD